MNKRHDAEQPIQAEKIQYTVFFTSSVIVSFFGFRHHLRLRIMNARILNRKIHYWASLVIGIPVIIVIVTGIILQVKKEFDWIQPPTQRGTSKELTLSFDQILSVVSTVPEVDLKNWEDINRLDVRPSKGIIKIRGENDWEVQIDSNTGEVLQVAERRSDWIESIHDGSWFHPSFKLWVFLPSAIILAVMWGTGVYLFVLPYLAKRKKQKKKSADQSLIDGGPRRLLTVPVPQRAYRGFAVVGLVVAVSAASTAAVFQSLERSDAEALENAPIDAVQLAELPSAAGDSRVEFDLPSLRPQARDPGKLAAPRATERPAAAPVVQADSSLRDRADQESSTANALERQTELAIAPNGGQETAPDQETTLKAARDNVVRVANWPSLDLRVGDHTGYSRMVFDWTTPTAYRIDQAQQWITVNFDTPARLDFSHFRSHGPLMNVAEFATKVSSNGLTVVLMTTADAGVRHFVDGTHVVVDVLRDGDPG